MPELSCLQATVYGYVQGVGFRAFVLRKAASLGLRGYVRNSEDGKAVEVVAEGEKSKLEDLINSLRTGPTFARVQRVNIQWTECTGSYRDFKIEY